MSTSGSDTAANSLMTSLMAGDSFTLPAVVLSDAKFTAPAAGSAPYGSATHLTNADLTTGAIAGTGTFDVLMNAFHAQLRGELEAGRITGEQYSKAYIELTTGAMANAVQFLLGRDQAYWASVTAQVQADIAQVQLVTARVELEQAKAKLQGLHYEALNNEATYALTKAKIATEDAAYGTAVYTLSTMLPAQKLLLDKQTLMTQEQTEAQRSQTSDTRTDGTAVTGLIGKQKLLYGQQIISYQRDSEVKAAKLFTDAWITMKTIDEGLDPPTGFANTSLDHILTALKTNNAL